MKAVILSVGDELILGQTVDTNSAWLSQQLAQVGVPVLAHITVGDDQNAIEQSVRESAERCELLLVTGGIGPTPDDLTRQALAAVMNQPLEINEKWLAELTSFFASRNRPMPEMNRIQAMIPRGAEMIWNHAGTAAGIHAKLCRVGLAPPSEVGGASPTLHCHVYVMPGVPKEMKLMFERFVLKKIKPESGGGVILSKTLHTFGLGESAVAELLGPLMDRTRNPTVGTTVSGGMVSVRINSRFESPNETQRQLDATTNECYANLRDLIFGEDDETLAQAVAKLLIERKAILRTAESCTGGLLSKMLTDVPGSSVYYDRGWVTYSNQSKIKLLGVSSQFIEEHGAVSEPVVGDMASRARLRGPPDATHALAISGIAGPGGGSDQKPVGTVCIGLSWSGDFQSPPWPTTVSVRTFLFPGDREMIRDRSAKMALAMLRFHLLGIPLPF